MRGMQVREKQVIRVDHHKKAILAIAGKSRECCPAAARERKARPRSSLLDQFPVTSPAEQIRASRIREDYFARPRGPLEPRQSFIQSRTAPRFPGMPRL